MEAPKFVHDCDQSLYLGTWVSPDGEIYDLYACKAHSGRDWVSLMARYGNEGHEYISGAIFKDNEIEGSLPIKLAAEALKWRSNNGQIDFSKPRRVTTVTTVTEETVTTRRGAQVDDW